MAQVKLVLVAAALLALVAVALAVPAKYRRDEGHAVSDSSSDSSDSSDSSSGESKEEHNRKRQPARNVPVSNDQHEGQDVRQDVRQDVPMGNAIPIEQEESDAVPPYPKPVRGLKGHIVEQKMEPGQPWESHYKHGVAPAKLPALETDNAHSYRHSIIHPYGDDLHA